MVVQRPFSQSWDFLRAHSDFAQGARLVEGAEEGVQEVAEIGGGFVEALRGEDRRGGRWEGPEDVTDVRLSGRDAGVLGVFGQHVVFHHRRAHEAAGDAVRDAQGTQLVADGVRATHGHPGADGVHGFQDAQLASMPGLRIHGMLVGSEEAGDQKSQTLFGRLIVGRFGLKGAESFDAMIDGSHTGRKPVDQRGQGA